MKANQSPVERDGSDALVRLVANVIFIDPLDPEERLLLAKHPRGFWEPIGGKRKLVRDAGSLQSNIETSARTVSAEVREELLKFPHDYPVSRFHHLGTHDVAGERPRHITRYLSLLPEGYIPELSTATDHTALDWFELAELNDLKQPQVIIESDEYFVRIGERLLRKEVYADLKKLLDSRLRNGSITFACPKSSHLIRTVFYHPEKQAVLLKRKAKGRGLAFPYIDITDVNTHIHTSLWDFISTLTHSTNDLTGQRIWLSSGINSQNIPAWLHFYLLYNADICEANLSQEDDLWFTITSQADYDLIDRNYREEIRFIIKHINHLLTRQGIQDFEKCLPKIIRPDCITDRGSVVLDWPPKK